MKHTGLSEAEWNIILPVFNKYPEVTGVILFGSRAKGTATPTSDIDLAIEGIDDPLRAESLAGELNELPLPYHFDVQALSTIQHAPLREHIARVGVRVYG